MSEIFQGVERREVIVSAKYGHTAFNSCIAWSPVEGYRLLIRDSNYTMSPSNLDYWMNDPDGVIRTITRMCVLDSELNVCEVEAIDDRDVWHIEWPLVRGVEDRRLFWHYDGWHSYGTIREAHWSGQCQIAEDWLEGTRVVKRVIHQGPEGLNRAEKNHMRLVGTDDWVYLCGPSQVRKADGSIVQAPWEVKPEAHGFRGGSPAIPHEDGYVACVHEVSWEPRPRDYYQRFVRFDANGFLTHFTPAFKVTEAVIEFCAGMVRWRDSFVISTGFAEARTYLSFVPVEEVERLWIPAIVA